MTLSVDEFLRRFLLHLLPKGFVRIRNFGFGDNTQKYLRYLELSSRPRLADIVFTIPRRRW